MPKNEEFDSKEVQKFLEHGYISENTKAARERYLRYFMEYLKSNFKEDLESIENDTFWVEIEKLENALIKYFSTYRKRNGDLPMLNHLDAARSHIKTMIKSKTKSAVDISDENQFPSWNRVWHGLCGKLKHHGKGDTKHHDSLTPDELQKMYDLLKILYKLMQIDESDKEFNHYIAQLPVEWREKYNYLAMYGTICLVIYQVSF